MPVEGVPYAKVGCVDGRWLIVVAVDEGVGTRVLTVGEEVDRAKAEEWGRLALAAQGWLPGNVDPPDAHERGELVAKHRRH